MRRFAQLFAGRTDVFGQYIVTEKRGDGKQKGRGNTKQEPLTEEVWEDHLAGRKMLGIVPIRLDGTVGWFAGDIDVYNIDHNNLISKIQSLEIPVVVCRSKSGGAHLYCFVNGTVKASVAIALMRYWLTRLGQPRAEVFPKQDEIKEGAIGNWINLPYYGGDNTERFAYGLSGERLSLAEFEQLANAYSVSPEELIELEKGITAPKRQAGEFDDAPPCIEKMFTDKLVEGGRNNSLTHIGIYYLKSDQDNWRDRIVQANYRVFDDPLPLDEVNQIVRNVSKAKYEYLCKVEPMCSICDKETCLTRKWGVGPQQGIDFASCEIDRIVKINADPPIFYVIINGQSVKMTTDQLLSPLKFRRRVYEITGNLIPPMKDRAHEARIQAARIEVEDAPPEVSAEGQIIEIFEDWCETHIPKSRSIDDVSRGNPYYDETENYIVFKGKDLIAAFKRSKKFNIADQEVWGALRQFGCQKANLRVSGKQTKVWVYPVDKPWFDLPGKEQF